MAKDAHNSRFTAANPRRSSRLNNVKGTKSAVFVHMEGRRPAKRRKVAGAEPDGLRLSSNTATHVRPAMIYKEPVVTPKDLSEREKALAKREQELQCRSEVLDEKLLDVTKKEEEVSHLLEQLEIRTATATLNQLEDHFSCALCYDVMACPYSLSPGKCGHTFCAVCILKWFFSRLHRACGGWHEPVDCPICRTMLPLTSDKAPRLNLTFPFTPNRTVDAVVQGSVEKLSVPTVSNMGNVRTVVKKTDELGAENGSLLDWRIGGKMRSDWQRRDSDGREEMSNLVNRWATFRAQDFIAIKSRLGV